MADIVGVRQFNQRLKNYQPGDQVVIVNGSKRAIVCTVEFKESPEEVVKTIKQIFRK